MIQSMPLRPNPSTLSFHDCLDRLFLATPESHVAHFIQTQSFAYFRWRRSRNWQELSSAKRDLGIPWTAWLWACLHSICHAQHTATRRWLQPKPFHGNFLNHSFPTTEPTNLTASTLLHSPLSYQGLPRRRCQAHGFTLTSLTTSLCHALRTSHRKTS